MDQFYRTEPTARTSWRQAVLMGANTRTYKFALAQALLDLAGAGADTPLLSELAARYSWHLTLHAQQYPQARGDELGPADFLTVLLEEHQDTLAAGQATERLIAAAVTSMPGMVMNKFHNLRGSNAIAHRFYDLTGKGTDRRVSLSDELRTLAASDHSTVLATELGTRWSVVEASFDAAIGPSLVRKGFIIDRQTGTALDKVRRKAVASLRPALSGFQHGRCLYCGLVLDILDGTAQIEHVYPFRLMNCLHWAGPDLDSLWNLVLLCPECNAAKSCDHPTVKQVQALINRNEAILGSPHPLKRTLQLSLGLNNTEQHNVDFYRAVDTAALAG